MSTKKLREQILSAEDLALTEIAIAEWGVTAYLRPLDGESRWRIGQIAANTDHKKENAHIAEAYICESLVTETGERIFELEHRAELARKNPIVIERLYKQILELSGIKAEQEAEAEKK